MSSFSSSEGWIRGEVVVWKDARCRYLFVLVVVGALVSFEIVDAAIAFLT